MASPDTVLKRLLVFGGGELNAGLVIKSDTLGFETLVVCPVMHSPLFDVDLSRRQPLFQIRQGRAGWTRVINPTRRQLHP